MLVSVLIFALATAASAQANSPAQTPFRHIDAHSGSVVGNHSGWLPRIDYASTCLTLDDDGGTAPPDGMVLHPLHISGGWNTRVDLTFFSDGYTKEEEKKFIKDARKLTADIVSTGGAMSHVAHLLNIYAVFVPSRQSGIGSHDTPLNGSAFGLYRPGPELRAVYVNHPKRARAACKYWRERGREAGEGGCDQPILLGNDPLYGGLGGEFTIITASELNGPLVLRHELGHSLIGVGEEYEGVDHLSKLKWCDLLTRPDKLKIEDVRVPLQAYPWHDLSTGPYSITFNSSSTTMNNTYPSALLRMSLSSIPYPDHIAVKLNNQSLDISSAFPPGAWMGSKDRRWVEVGLPHGIPEGRGEIEVSLTDAGADEPAGQGGKMITSVEIMEYGQKDRCNLTEGFIGAFPTYDINGKVNLRPTNEACLMRKVNHPTFCPVCARGLEEALHRRIRKKPKERAERAAVY